MPVALAELAAVTPTQDAVISGSAKTMSCMVKPQENAFAGPKSKESIVGTNVKNCQKFQGKQVL